MSNDDNRKQICCERLPTQKRYHLSVEVDGKQSVLEVGEYMHRKLSEQLRDAQLPLMLTFPELERTAGDFFLKQKVKLKLPKNRPVFFDPSYVWTPLIPHDVTPTYFKNDLDIKFTSKVMKRYAKSAVRHDFYGKVLIGGAEVGHVNVGYGAGPTNPHGEIKMDVLDGLMGSGKPINTVISPPAVIADPSRYPHQCPKCSAPAYIGFASVDCSRKACS